MNWPTSIGVFFLRIKASHYASGLNLFKLPFKKFVSTLHCVWENGWKLRCITHILDNFERRFDKGLTCMPHDSRCFPNMPQGASSFDDVVFNHKNYYWLFSSSKICFFRIRPVSDQADRNREISLLSLALFYWLKSENLSLELLRFFFG